MTALYPDPIPAHYSPDPHDKESVWERILVLGARLDAGADRLLWICYGDGTTALVELDHVRFDWRFVAVTDPDTKIVSFEWKTIDELAGAEPVSPDPEG